MTDFLLNNYLWLKSFHLIAVISWMAGMLYLPRLYVYHAQSKIGSEQSETFKTMENKLLRFIMNPAMILTWFFALLLIAANPDIFSQGWMHVKFMGVILMSVLHMVFAKWRKDFAADKNTHTDKFYRWWNEAPTILLIIVVIMVVAKPF